jgi:hypothetical protein
MLPGILDAVAHRAQVATTYAMALSFSGHLALRAAAEDRRIRGVVTAGAPVHAFFTDTEWLKNLPQVTADTLARLTGTPVESLPDLLAPWALSPGLISSLDIPVACTASRRDEIIPADDVRFLHDHARRLELVQHDDVHGSPRHGVETRLWALLSILRMHGVRDLRTGALRGVLRLLRARTRGATRPRTFQAAAQGPTPGAFRIGPAAGNRDRTADPSGSDGGAPARVCAVRQAAVVSDPDPTTQRATRTEELDDREDRRGPGRVCRGGAVCTDRPAPLRPGRGRGLGRRPA